jgi:hypothetical protein
MESTRRVARVVRDGDGAARAGAEDLPVSLEEFARLAAARMNARRRHNWRLWRELLDVEAKPGKT